MLKTIRNDRKETVGYVVFVDLEKAFDRVAKNMIWSARRKKGVIEREVLAITELYKNISTNRW